MACTRKDGTAVNIMCSLYRAVGVPASGERAQVITLDEGDKYLAWPSYIRSKATWYY